MKTDSPSPTHSRKGAKRLPKNHKATVKWSDLGLLLFYDEPNKNLPAHLEWLNLPCAVLPFSDEKRARLAVRFANLSYEGKGTAIYRILQALTRGESNRAHATDQILTLIGHSA